MKRFLIALILVTLAASAAQAEDKKNPGTSFHDRVVATYNFLPRNLDQKAIDAKSKENVTAQKSLLILLGYSVTKKGDEAIRRFAADPTKPEESRSYARDILDAAQSMAQSPLGLSLSSYASLKSERKKLLARVSDEALLELEDLQIKLRRKGAH